MHAQLWPLYAIGALMFLYVLFGIARDAWELLKYQQDTRKLIEDLKRRNDLNNV